MSLSCVEVDRFAVGGFGDLRLQKRGRGAIKHWLRVPAHAFWNLAEVCGVARSGLAGSCATRR
jgi:hypothetical protein